MTSGFSELAMTLLQDKPSAKKLDNPTHVGYAGEEGGGDYVVAEFEVEGSVVKDFGYRCNGCPTTIACCELLGRLLKGAIFEKRGVITGDVLTKLLGTPVEAKQRIPAFVGSVLISASELKAKVNR